MGMGIFELIIIAAIFGIPVLIGLVVVVYAFTKSSNWKSGKVANSPTCGIPLAPADPVCLQCDGKK